MTTLKRIGAIGLAILMIMMAMPVMAAETEDTGELLSGAGNEATGEVEEKPEETKETATPPANRNADRVRSTKPLAIKSAKVTTEDKVYDGKVDAKATVADVEFDGLDAGDELELDKDYKVTSKVFEDANAGKDKKVTVTIELIKTTTLGQKYDLVNGEREAKATINKAPLNVKASTAEGMVYNGKVETKGDVTFDGLITVSGSKEVLAKDTDYKTTAKFDNANVGEKKSVEVTAELVGSGPVAKNYLITTGKDKATAHANITKKTIEIKSAAVADRIYNGEEGATVTSVIFGGLVEGDKLAKEDYTASAKFADKNAGENKKTTVTVELKAHNYALSSSTFSGAVATIEKAEPEYEVPTGLKATVGQKLGDVKLPDGFAWEQDASLVIKRTGTHTLKVMYVPEDETNYMVKEGIEVEIKVEAASSTSKTNPKNTAKGTSSNSSGKGTAAKSNPKTGDVSSVGTMLAVMLASGVGIIDIISYKKKKSKNK